MKYKITILSICLLSVFQLKAQLFFSYSAGYGDYSMGNMKEIMESAERSLSNALDGLKLHRNGDFSGGLTHTFNLGGKSGGGELGINGSFYTAQSRLSYADYSGYLDYKLHTTGLRLGLFFRGHFYQVYTGNHSSFSVFIELSPGLIFSKLEEKASLVIYNPENAQPQKNTENKRLDYKRFTVMPLAGIRYSVNQWLGLNIQGGYDWYPNSGGLKKPDDPMDWSGFRISGGISFVIK
jgi:hypothetical protein